VTRYSAMHLIGFLTVCCSFAHAEGLVYNYSVPYYACLREAGDTNALLTCVAAEKNKWDVRLVNSYQTLMDARGFSSETKQRLSEAQELWNIFREKSCDADGALDAEDGSGFELARAGCSLEMTAQRALELERRLPHAAETRRSPAIRGHGSTKSNPDR